MRATTFGIRVKAFLAAAMTLLVVQFTAQAAPIQWTGTGSNGHYYEIARSDGTNAPAYGGLSWTEAQTLAASAGGYLATITSSGENAFIAGLLESSTANRAWIGGTDSAVEGTFKWADGPENGNTFTYTSWFPGEPNNNTNTYGSSGGPPNPEGEDYAEMYSSRVNNGSGKWNDLPNAGTPGIGYVVEYDGVPVPEPTTLVGAVALLAILPRRFRCA